MICAWRKLKYNTSTRVLHRTWKLAVREEKPSLLYNLSCEGRDDKRASLALVLVFLYSVAHCQIWNGLRIQPVPHSGWTNEICERGLLWLESSPEWFLHKKCYKKLFLLYFQINLLLQTYRYYQVDAHRCVQVRYVNVFTLLPKMYILIPVLSSLFPSIQKGK